MNQEVQVRIIPAVFICLALCLQSEAEEPLRLNLGESSSALHVMSGEGWVEVVPAFEDYAFMMFDVCDAMELSGDACLIYPMNGDLGGNAIATVLDGNQLIVYDRTLSLSIGYAGAEMVIAHEVGHHLCGHLNELAEPAQELEADAFAGAAMKLLGRSLDDALSAVGLFSSRPSRSHPAVSDRISAIRLGWTDPEAGRSCIESKH